MPLDANPFDQFDKPAEAQGQPAANPFDQFDAPSAQAQSDQPGMLSNIGSAAKAGFLQDVRNVAGLPGTLRGQAQGEAAGQPQPWQEPLSLSDLVHPSRALPKITYQLAQSGSTLAAGTAGAVVGEAIEPAGGGLVGGPLAAGAMTAINQLTPLFAEEMRKPGADPDKAFNVALGRAAQSGLFSGAGWAAFGANLFQGPVKNLLFQAFGVQPGMSVAQQGVENVEQGKPLTEGMEAAYLSGAAGTLIPAAGTHFAARLAGAPAAPAAEPSKAVPPDAQAAAPGAAPAAAAAPAAYTAPDIPPLPPGARPLPTLEAMAAGAKPPEAAPQKPPATPGAPPVPAAPEPATIDPKAPPPASVSKPTPMADGIGGMMPDGSITRDPEVWARWVSEWQPQKPPPAAAAPPPPRPAAPPAPPPEAAAAPPPPPPPATIRTLQQIMEQDGVGAKQAAQTQAQEIAAIGRPISNEEREARAAGIASAPPRRAAAPPPEPARSEAGPGSVGYAMVRPSELTLDPQRFQYKEADEAGVTGALRGVQKWEPALANPITAWQGNDGKLYVVNGHQRTDLARRAEAAGQDVQMPAKVYREADGYTPDDMKVLGAYQNIAEGSGTAIDAAKVLRGQASLPASRQMPELPPNSQLVQQGRGLANLSDEAFGAVVNGVVPSAYAAHVGAMLKDPREQMAAIDVLARGQPQNSQQARMMVQDVRDSGFFRGAQTTLFGDQAFAQSMVPERAKILDAALQNLRRGKNLFRAAVEGEGELAKAGNQMDRAANEKVRADNERLIEILDRDATKRGDLSDALSAAARDLAGGKKLAGATADFLARARAIVRGQEGAPLRSGDTGRGGEPAEDAGPIADPNQGGLMEARERLADRAVPLHSAVARAVDGLKQAKGTGEQFLAQIMNTPGVKPEEVKWIGLADWLRGQKSVTKQDIADYVRANALDVREVVKDDATAASETRYPAYTLPGAGIYRELLITLPPRGATEDPAIFAREMRQKYGDQYLMRMSDQEISHLGALESAYEESERRQTYQSSHWDEPNVLAHIRFSDRVGADGNKTLLVEEAQSDWHQAGRRKGYKEGTPPKIVNYATWGEQHGMTPQEVNATFHTSDPRFLDWEKHFKAAVDAAGKYVTAVPDAPFKTTWPSLVMRRMVQYAVDHGYDRVAWSPGDVQTERYDLSKHINDITLHGTGDNLRLTATDINNRVVIDQQHTTREGLADIIGKEAADKLLAQPEPNPDNPYAARNLFNADIKVGGEGMRGFYDDILPKETQKIVGKYGAKVGRSDIATGSGEKYDVVDRQGGWRVVDRGTPRGDYIGPRFQSSEDAQRWLVEQGYTSQPVHSFDITPAMRKAIEQQGLALFSRKIAAPGQRDIFGGEAQPRATREAEPTIRTDKRQETLPGMEPTARQAQAARDQAGPRTGQEPANQGLFAPRGAAPQPDMFGAKPERPANAWRTSAGMNDVLDQFPRHDPQAAHETAADWVLRKGAETGHEFLAAVDNATGRVVQASTNGLKDEVTFDPANLRALPPDSVTLHHNHPENSSLSSADLKILAFPAVSHIVAHDGDGNTYIASIGDRYRNQRADSGLSLKITQDYLKGQFDQAVMTMQRMFARSIELGEISVKQAAQMTNDVVMRILAHHGVINYETTRVLPSAVADRLRSRMIQEGYGGRGGSSRGYTRTIRADNRTSGLPRPAAEQPESRAPVGQGRDQNAGTVPPGSRQARLLETSRLRQAAEDADLGALREEAARLAPLKPDEERRIGPVRAAVMGIMDRARDVGFAVQQMLAPMSTGSGRAQNFAATFANAIRQVAYRYGTIDREITRTFAPAEREAMGRAMDAQSVFEQRVRDLPPDEQAKARAEFDAGKTGVAGLRPEAQRTLHLLDRLSQDVWRRMQERGMVAPNARPIPWYFSRQILMRDEDGGFARPGGGGGGGGNRGIEPIGRNLTTAGPMRREHLTPEETESAARKALGGNAVLVRDIRSLVSKLQQHERAIAGVDLMNKIDEVGRDTGVNLVVKGDIPGLLHPGDYFTIADHPAFRQWTGAGWKAIHVAREFEGPLKAVLSKTPDAWYRGAMAAKSTVMSAIMWSPFIHLAVEMGRALPVMPGRVLSLQALRDGSRLRRDLGYMDTATRDGLAPLGHSWAADPTTIAQEAAPQDRGRWAKAIIGARDAAANAAGKIGGDFLHDVVQHPHQALLWDQVFNLQVGIYDTLRSKWIKDGYSPEGAGAAAAHMANRYAGALPAENLSRGANMAANLLLFSRSFTLGNLGVMKDMLTGGPSHLMARIEALGGAGQAKAMQNTLRRKALSAFALDIGLFYMANGLLQAGIQAVRQGPQTAADDWQRKAQEALSEVEGGNPLAIFGVLPQHWNEPGRENRVYAGTDDDGKGIYLRLPAGKVGEEFVGWMSKPGTMVADKMSPLVRPLVELILGRDSLGRELLPPHPHTIGDYIDTAGAIVQHIAANLGPVSTVDGAADLFRSQVLGEPSQGDRGVALAKVLGPMTGLATVSSGRPGGPAAAEIAAQSETQRYAVAQAMPDIRRMIVGGDTAGAVARMNALGIAPGLQRYYMQQTLHPQVSKSQMRNFQRTASPEDRARLGTVTQ